MKEFFLEYETGFYMLAFIPLAIAWYSLNFYTGETKKLSMMIRDIRKTGRVSKITLEYDKMRNNNIPGIDATAITHLIFFIPNAKENEILYKDKFFLNQLSIVKGYRMFYKIALLFSTMVFLFIYLMNNL